MSAKFDFRTLSTGYAADWPVIVPTPVDGGKIEERTFMARFRTPTPEIEAEADKIEMAEGQAARLKHVMRYGFEDLAKEEGESLTPELFETLWSAPNVQLALIRAYGQFRTGTPAKN